MEKLTKDKMHQYQIYCVGYIKTHLVCGIFLDCGLGKSIIALTVIWDLALDSFDIGKILVIAPKRVAENTWQKELAKWEHLTGLSYSLVLGSKKQREEALAQKASMYIIASFGEQPARLP